MEDITNFFIERELRQLNLFDISLDLNFVQNYFPYLTFSVSIQECYSYCLMNHVSLREFLHFNLLILYNMD
jgi:hypothetical protein